MVEIKTSETEPNNVEDLATTVASGAIDVSTEETKTVSVEEMQRRIQKEKERYEALENSIQDRLKKAMEEYQREMSMDENEKAEAEKQALQKKIEELERERSIRQIKDTALDKLKAEEIDTDDSVLNLVLRDSEQGTEEAIEQLKHVLSNYKKTLIGDSKLPISGGIVPEKKDEGSDRKSLYEKHKIQ